MRSCSDEIDRDEREAYGYRRADLRLWVNKSCVLKATRAKYKIKAVGAERPVRGTTWCES